MATPATRPQRAPSQTPRLRLLPTLAFAAALLALAGCSQRALYQSAQAWQQQECWKLSNAAERQRCLASSATSWDAYQRQREAAQGPK